MSRDTRSSDVGNGVTGPFVTPPPTRPDPTHSYGYGHPSPEPPAPRPTAARREWFVRLDVECATCLRADSAGVGSTSCEDARQNAMKVLRYRGWQITQKRGSDRCPEHAPPLPTCDLCDEPTPTQYGHRLPHITGVPFACRACYLRKFDEKRRERR